MADFYPLLVSCCLEEFRTGRPASPMALAERMMGLEGLPMHCPEHHFIVPAALLTPAFQITGRSGAELEKTLVAAAARAKRVPGGACGALGCCGAAVGCGIFVSLLLGADPKREEGWSAANAMTARCLANVASVGGPRCCKRVTCLALEEAVRQAPELAGITFPEGEAVVCTRAARNAECKRAECPYFPHKYREENKE